LRFLAKQTGLVVLPERDQFPAAWDMALAITQKELGRGNMVGITVDGRPGGERGSKMEDGGSKGEKRDATMKQVSSLLPPVAERPFATGSPHPSSILHPQSSSLDPPASPADMEKFLEDIRGLTPTVIVPVYCGTAAHLANGPAPTVRRIRVVIGHPMSPTTSFADARREISMLGEWIRHADHPDVPPGTIMIPGGKRPSPPHESPPDH
jgi:hypothetical protein